MNSSRIPILEEAHKIRFSLSILVYLAAMFSVLDAALKVSLFQTLSVTKGLFAAACMDVQDGVLRKTVQSLAQEQRPKDVCLTFMNCIFHWIRTPLNSISMGLELIEECQGLDELERKLMVNMK
jgi:hypothetical protein